jgi:hypothetical protein
VRSPFGRYPASQAGAPRLSGPPSPLTIVCRQSLAHPHRGCQCHFPKLLPVDSTERTGPDGRKPGGGGRPRNRVQQFTRRRVAPSSPGRPVPGPDRAP